MLQRPLQDIVFGSGPFVSRWTDREGNNREAVEIVADNAYFCGSKMADADAQRDQGPMNEDALPDMAA